MLRVTQQQRGFTLIEVMVVVVIIGIIASFATLSIGVADVERELQEEARRLGALISLAQQEAVLQNREYALRLYPERYEFLTLGGSDWVVMRDDNTLHPRSFKTGVSLHATILDGSLSMSQEEGVDQAMLYILSSGEISPFELTLSAGDSQYGLRGDFMGRMQLFRPQESSL